MTVQGHLTRLAIITFLPWQMSSNLKWKNSTQLVWIIPFNLRTRLLIWNFLNFMIDSTKYLKVYWMPSRKISLRMIKSVLYCDHLTLRHRPHIDLSSAPMKMKIHEAPWDITSPFYSISRNRAWKRGQRYGYYHGYGDNVMVMISVFLCRAS